MIDECGINGVVYTDDAMSGVIEDGGNIQGQMDGEGNLVGEVGFPKCCCDYDELVNKPSINGVELVGNKTTEDLGIEAGVQSVNGQTGEVVLDIPTATSDLTNDSGFITLADIPPIPTATSDLTNDSGFITDNTNNLVNYYTKSEVDGLIEFPKDLGEFDIEDYDWEYWNYLNDKVDSGFYEAYEVQDGFNYFFRVERTGDCAFQEIWSTEESGTVRYVRSGRYVDGEWEWSDPQRVMYSDDIAATYYSKNEINNLLNNYYTDVQIDDILDNNYYTMDQVDDMLDDISVDHLISTTWANLVSLRDSGQLNPGVFYRITDYNFVTSSIDVRSGNHPFDIVVLAISESMVSETAYAVRHAGDHYYEREITTGGIEWLYTLFVDDYAENYGNEPIDHADDLHPTDIFCAYDYGENPLTGDIVPILYKTDSNEYDFDDPDYADSFYYSGTYDLDGDEYDMWAKFEGDTFAQQYALTPVVVENDELTVSPVPETKTVPVNMNAWELKYCLDNDKELFAWADTNGKGVIYYMKDEFGNEAPYDFKNIMFARRYITSVGNSLLNSMRNNYWGENDYKFITTNNQVQYFYTFWNPTENRDASLFGDDTYNVIMPWITDGQRQLNNIVMHLGSNNTFRFGTHNCTFAQGCSDNDVNGSYLLISGLGSCVINGMFNSTIWQMSQCTVGASVREVIANALTTTVIGDGCYTLVFGQNLYSSHFEAGCGNITTGNYCGNIYMHHSVNTVTLGMYCDDITIGAVCSNITLGNYYRYIEIEETCARVTLNTSGGSVTNRVRYVTVEKNVSNITKQPTRGLAHETIYYKTGRTETAV